MNVKDRIPGLEHSKTTPRYSMWHMDELELRSFLVATSTAMRAWFKAEEEAAEDEADRTMNPEDSYGDEGYNLFMDRVGIFWEQYWYQLAAAVIKDAFTLYEVFLEESAHDLLRRHGSGLRNLSTEKTWLLEQCDDFYKRYLGFPIKRDEIEHVQWIRNKMSHLRDSLRTPEGKAEFAGKIEALDISGDPGDEESDLGLPHHEYGRELAFGPTLTLSPLEAWRVLNLLRKHVEELTLILHKIQYGRYTTKPLHNLSEGTPVNERDRKLLIVPDPKA
jgi:hypothetical protein